MGSGGWLGSRISLRGPLLRRLKTSYEGGAPARNTASGLNTLCYRPIVSRVADAPTVYLVAMPVPAYLAVCMSIVTRMYRSDPVNPVEFVPQYMPALSTMLLSGSPAAKRRAFSSST